MMETGGIVMPSIKILLSERFTNRDVLLEVMSGVEEESVPYEIVNDSLDDSTQLSYKGSFESVLGVSIGLDSQGYCSVHAKTLPENRPLFRINYNTEREKLRAICSNSARLVKGIPFIL